jgi:high affinity Mn2+ porin
MRNFRALPMLVLAISQPALAEPDPAEMSRLLQAMQDRLGRLETRNAELERRLNEVTGSLEKPSAGAAVNAITRRVEDVEQEVVTLRRATKPLAAVEGIFAEAALTMVGQRAMSGTTTGKNESQVNYRADVTVNLPGGKIGDGEGKFFVHFRGGQGDGLGDLPLTLTSTPNSTAFQLSDGDDAAILLAQAWYQLDVPVGRGGDLSGSLEITVGKIDPFVFFDQNAIADNETEAFLNNVFVHNPLLDSGGDMDVDAYGFGPGLRLAYFSHADSPNRWGISLGILGSGTDSSFNNSLDKPFLIAQAEYSGKTWRELDGAYRIYVWRSRHATPYANEADSTTEIHVGWGISLDQKVTEHLALFSRYGHSSKGRVRFDRALTLGGQLSGDGWGRQKDRLGLAWGWLSASRHFKADAPTLDADADGKPDFGFTPTGAEREVELFYAWQLNDHLQLSPNLQWIARPGGDDKAENITILGLRAKVAY